MSYSNFNTFKLFQNVGINSSSNYVLSMKPNDNNVSFHSSNSIDYNNVDIMSIKNIINKKQNEDLNLSSLTGTTINPVITINNNNQDCRIMTNLNVAGNVNISNNVGIGTTNPEKTLDVRGTVNISANEEGAVCIKRATSGDCMLSIKGGDTGSNYDEVGLAIQGAKSVPWWFIGTDDGNAHLKFIYHDANKEEDYPQDIGGGSSTTQMYLTEGGTLNVTGDIECNTLYGQITKNNYAGPGNKEYGWSLPNSSGTGSSCAVWNQSWYTIASFYSGHNHFIRHFVRNVHSTISTASIETRIGWEGSTSSLTGTTPGTLSKQAYVSIRPQGSNAGLLSFTGQHRNVPNNIDIYNNINNYIGYIVCSTGNYKTYNYDKEILEEKKNGITINDALPIIELSNKKQQKTVFGVISDKEEDERKLSMGAFCTPYSNINDDKRLYINSIGEGGIWIVNTNGNLENGDYIQSSSVIGLGEKQDDDILHSYTVAKITCDCNFELNTDNYECIEFVDPTSGNTYKKAFVGCSYHCG